MSVARDATSHRTVGPQADAPAELLSADRHASAERLTEMIYELLDAHADTAALADGLEHDREWDAHLDYLRALQRVVRARLAAGLSSDGSKREVR